MNLETHPNVQRLLDSPFIEQRSREWFEYRRSRVTASEVSAVLARGKGATSLMIAKKASAMLGGVSNEYTRIGSENEEEVVRLYNLLYPEVRVYHDLPVVPHPEFNFIAASLDACTNTGINVEIKTIFGDRHVKVCKAHRDQVQLQMEVSGLETTHLVHHYYRMDGQPIVVHTIQRDRGWFERSKPVIEEFIDRMRAYFPFDMEVVREQMSRAARASADFHGRRAGRHCMFEMSRVRRHLSAIACGFDMRVVRTSIRRRDTRAGFGSRAWRPACTRTSQSISRC